MASLLTVRIDKKTRARIARIARRKNISASEAVREAIEGYAAEQEAFANPFESIKHLLGSVRGGDPLRSTRTGAGFKKLLKERGRKA